MLATISYWDYPPLHQSSAELVLCALDVGLLKEWQYSLHTAPFQMYMKNQKKWLEKWILQQKM